MHGPHIHKGSYSMKKLLLAGLAASALSLAAFTPAEAQGGCGPFAHRGWYGHCRPNGYGYGWHRPYGYGYGYGWHRPYYGWHRPWGYYHRWG